MYDGCDTQKYRIDSARAQWPSSRDAQISSRDYGAVYGVALLACRTEHIMPQPHYDLLVKLLLIGDSGALVH